MLKIKKFKMTQNEKIYKLEDGFVSLFQIQALVDIPMHGVKAGDLGGFIQEEKLLSHKGNAWVKDGARLAGKSFIEGDVLIEKYGIVESSELSDGVTVSGYARIIDSYVRGDNVRIEGKAKVIDCEFHGTNIHIDKKAKLVNLFGTRRLNDFRMTDKATIENDVEFIIGGDNITILNDVQILQGRNLIGDNIHLSGNALINGGSRIQGNNVTIQDHAVITGVNLYDNMTVKECATLFCSADYHLGGIQGIVFQGDLEIDVETL